MRRKDLELTLQSKTNINMFLINNGLPTTTRCPTCYSTVHIDLENLSFSCRKRNPSGRCLFKKSFKLDGFSDKMRFGLETYIFIIFEWSRSTPSKFVGYDLDISVSTINRMYNKLNKLSAEFLFLNSKNIIGGEGVAVEIDESMFVKRKNNKGRILTGQNWVFGGVEKENWNNYFVEFVKDRKTDTLADVISRRIAPGTCIHSDEWPAYKKVFKTLEAYDYQHKTVCHVDNWINPEDGTHTQNIEGFWSLIKREMKKHGSNRGNCESLTYKMHAICFKRIYDSNAFLTIFGNIIKS